MEISYWIVNKLGTVIGQVQVTYLGSVLDREQAGKSCETANKLREFFGQVGTCNKLKSFDKWQKAWNRYRYYTCTGN